MRFFRVYFSAVLLLFFLTILFSLQGRAATSERGGISWQAWSEGLLERARRENRFVFLDLEAVWCHWCHVMDRKTYADPKVQALLETHFLPVKVDQDSRPDLSRRYQDYGWPATIIFNPQGQEILKRAGYISPEEMAEILQTIVSTPASAQAKPVPTGSSVASPGVLSEALRRTLIRRHEASWDEEEGGLALLHKFLDADGVEYSLEGSSQGDAREETRARRFLEANLALLDPAWGGFYQYSAQGDWRHPHFEKIMAFQARNMEAYAQAYLYFGDETFLNAAEAVHRYLRAFLTSPEGSFYNSQDADWVPGQPGDVYFSWDDKARRKRGMPRIDRHRYTRENGWAIESLARLFMASGRPEPLADARRAANWVLRHRPLTDNAFQAAQYLVREGKSPAGGFRRSERDEAGPYLGDNLAIARAFLALYTATGERDWLRRAETTARFIQEHFSSVHSGAPAEGFLSAVERGPFPPVFDIDENLAAARFFNLLFHYTGNAGYQESARQAMRHLVREEIATRRISEPGILLADKELQFNPLHVTVVGSKKDPQAQALFQAALRFPTSYKRIEWWDKSEGPMPNPDVTYPEMKSAAAFVCTRKLCSAPVFQAEQIPSLVAKLSRKMDGEKTVQ